MDDLDLGATIKGFSPGQKVFKRYTLQRLLGRGGMGVVWLAHDDALERPVALKFLPELVALDPEAMADLKNETRRNLDLTHPHIVRIYDFVADGRAAAISMEYVDGSSLGALKLERPERVFTVEELTPWVEQLCDALSYAHDKARIVHRDLKPANLMLTGRGDVKITDFGIARGIADSVSRVSAQLGSTSGTPLYMSPQQMMGEKPAVTDDIYALGATLFELLTGKPPFHSGNVILQVQSKLAPSLAERRQELGVTGGGPLPAAWEETLAACLAKDPADRPASVRELRARLAGAPAPAPVSPPSTPTPPAAAVKVETPPPKSKVWVSHLRRWLGAPLVAALLPSLTVAGFWWGYLRTRSVSTVEEMTALVTEGGLAALGGFLVLFWLVIIGLRLARVRQPIVSWLFGGGVGAAVASYGFAWMVARLTHDAVGPAGTPLPFSLLLVCGLGGFVTGLTAARILHRWAVDDAPPIEKSADRGRCWTLTVLLVLGSFGTAAWFFAHMPAVVSETREAEYTRQYQIWEDNNRREREAAAPAMIREAYRMVFDRAPDASTVAEYTRLLIDNPYWSEWDLRRALRESPQGRQGGRLLVPEEFTTINAALRAAVPGNAVHIAPGTYVEAVFINQAVELIGADRDRVVIQQPANASALFVGEVDGPVVVKGITFQHTSTNEESSRFAVVVLGKTRVTLEQCRVNKSNGNGVRLLGAGTYTLRHNVIQSSRWAGVTLSDGATAEITDNLIENNAGIGLAINGPVTAVTLARNTARANRQNGLWIGSGDNVTVIDNQVSGNGTEGDRFGGIGIGAGRPVLRGNLARDNQGEGIWWRSEADPRIERGNISDGTELPLRPAPGG
jgi:serine/threonine protein kinase